MSDLNAFVNPVVRGIINPNKTITYKKELHFDSRFRDNYGAPKSSASSFLFNLPEEIDNVVSLRLASIGIPSIPLTISKSNDNNLFYIDANNGILTPIEIDEGNYSLSELLSLINDKIKDKFSTTVPILKFSKAQSEEKTKIANTTETPIQIIFYQPENCTNFMSTLGWLLGFRKASITISKESTVVSCGLFDNNFIDYLYFSADDFQRNVSDNNIVYLNKTTMNKNILGKIYRSPSNGTYLLNTKNSSTSYDVDRSRIYFGPVRLSKFKFSLLDKFGNQIDLHNMDYSFTLEVEVLYDRNNVTIPC
jgi:hypothetical protein